MSEVVNDLTYRMPKKPSGAHPHLSDVAGTRRFLDGKFMRSWFSGAEMFNAFDFAYAVRKRETIVKDVKRRRRTY